MTTVFLDTNVLLDLFLEREEVDNAEIIVSEIYNDRLHGYISTKSVLDIHYLLRKKIGGPGSQNVLETLCKKCKLIEVDGDKVIKALQKQNNDLEDQVQLECALSRKNIKYIITRNGKDFKTDLITVISPKEFLKIYQ